MSMPFKSIFSAFAHSMDIPSSSPLNADPTSRSRSSSLTSRTHQTAACTAAQPISFRTSIITSEPTIPEDEYSTSPTSPILSSSVPRSPSQLRVVTDVHGTTLQSPPRVTDTQIAAERSSRLSSKQSVTSLRPLGRTPSLKAAISNCISSGGGPSNASSLVPSPVIAAMGDVTPLPSPLLYDSTDGPWRAFANPRPPSNDESESIKPINPETVAPVESETSPTTDVPCNAMLMPFKVHTHSGSAIISETGESIDATLANGIRRKNYTSLNYERERLNVAQHPAYIQQHHARNRSLSEFVPNPIAIPKRMVTVSGPHKREAEDASKRHMRRETNFAESRGVVSTYEKPPTPPPSESSKSSLDGGTEKPKGPAAEYFEAYGRFDGKKRRWRAVKVLGQGTFSRVVLATSEVDISDETLLAMSNNNVDVRLDRKTLVAVKVCEHGPKGGASEDRIEMSLKRELEIMRIICHPSLVNLKAFNIEMTRALLVLTHCPGGDLFDVATTNRAALKPALLRRIFSEIVGAVRYLHSLRIVHRDIKLENVLVNLRPSELSDPVINWTTYPYSVITVTDLGLSRQIKDDEKLETRCGSEDYAAPEVIMGQPYDGRATDAWSLGVLLYVLLEARLPFDPHPGVSDYHRMRSRTSHRIARVEWRWVEYEGEDGDHEGSIAKFKAAGLLGAMEITEGLLKRARSRWTLDQVAENEWVREALKIPGGLQYREEQEGVEV